MGFMPLMSVGIAHSRLPNRRYGVLLWADPGVLDRAQSAFSALDEKLAGSMVPALYRREETIDAPPDDVFDYYAGSWVGPEIEDKFWATLVGPDKLVSS